MATDENESDQLRSVVMQNARSVRNARQRLERELIQANEALKRKTEELTQSQARYHWALVAGRLVHWETDLIAGTRTWTKEALELFGLTLADGRGRFGGEADEFMMSVHPTDRHLVKGFYELAERQDWFPVEYRILKPDGALRWLSGGCQVVARGADGTAQRLIHVVADITDRKVTEDHNRFLVSEITHRSKNLLAVVQGIAAQAGRTAKTFDEFQTRYMQRLQGLAASHDLLISQNWKGASLSDLIHDQLAPFAELGGTRLRASGPDIFLSPAAAEAMGLAFHELATNAVKYGALSVPIGQVTVSWTLDDYSSESRQLRLSWVEQGGPIVKPPSHKGFGHIVFERIVSHSLGGNVAMDFAPGGLNWNLSMPTAHLVTERAVILNRVS